MNQGEDVKNWWADHPMTYGDLHGETNYGDSSVQLGEKAFFKQADERFLEWNHPLHQKEPFDRLFPFSDYQTDARVLEVGCGMGFMSSLWAKRGVKMVSLDLNPTAVRMTQKRFQTFSLKPRILQASALSLPLADQIFDYVYSWGVLHHSPDLGQSIKEFFRVLKPGGGFGIMLYHRDSLWYRYRTAYVEGYLHDEDQHLNELELASRYGDGHDQEGNPHTWPVTQGELKGFLSPFSRQHHIKVLGTEVDGMLSMILPGLGLRLPRMIKKSISRRLGWSLWAFGKKDL